MAQIGINTGGSAGSRLQSRIAENRQRIAARESEDNDLGRIMAIAKPAIQLASFALPALAPASAAAPALTEGATQAAGAIANTGAQLGAAGGQALGLVGSGLGGAIDPSLLKLLDRAIMSRFGG